MSGGLFIKLLENSVPAKISAKTRTLQRGNVHGVVLMVFPMYDPFNLVSLCETGCLLLTELFSYVGYKRNIQKNLIMNWLNSIINLTQIKNKPI